MAAFEIMLDSPPVRDLIFQGEVQGIKKIMSRSRELGMQTVDEALFDLCQQNVISYEDALRFADSTNDLRLRIMLERGGRQPVQVKDKSDIHIV